MKDETIKNLAGKIESKVDSFTPEQLAVVFYGINSKKYQIGGTLWMKIEEILSVHVINYVTFFLFFIG